MKSSRDLDHWPFVSVCFPKREKVKWTSDRTDEFFYIQHRRTKGTPRYLHISSSCFCSQMISNQIEMYYHFHRPTCRRRNERIDLHWRCRVAVWAANSNFDHFSSCSSRGDRCIACRFVRFFLYHCACEVEDGARGYLPSCMHAYQGRAEMNKSLSIYSSAFKHDIHPFLSPSSPRRTNEEDMFKCTIPLKLFTSNRHFTMSFLLPHHRSFIFKRRTQCHPLSTFFLVRTSFHQSFTRRNRWSMRNQRRTSNFLNATFQFNLWSHRVLLSRLKSS